MPSPDHRARDLERYRASVDYIDRELVRLSPRRRSLEGKVEAALAFNRALDNPQAAYPSIQVAGTSGKGTVCHLIASTLAAAGLGTGCHVSPYLQSFTEKSWIDGRYCSVERLAAAVDRVRPVADAFAAEADCPASVHGMASLAVSYVAFRDADIEVAVMETGLGGRFDLVQGLRRELSVITDLGLDHTTALGPTLEEIAWHKAGIMRPGVPCVAARGDGWRVLTDEARRLGTPLHPVDFGPETRPDASGRLALRLEHVGEIVVKLDSDAPFAARNAAVAAAAIDRLAGGGWPIKPEHLRTAFRARMPGRLEIVQASPRVVLDCAHNPQKIAALCEALDGADLTVVFAATGGRSPVHLLERLAKRTGRLIATDLELYGKETVDARAVADQGARLGIESVALAPPEAALDRALEITPSNGTVLITGSVYLVGRLRDRWFPTEEVILQRSSWPTPVEA